VVRRQELRGRRGSRTVARIWPRTKSAAVSFAFSSIMMSAKARRKFVPPAAQRSAKVRRRSSSDTLSAFTSL
jgi:hypothetical protein